MVRKILSLKMSSEVELEAEDSGPLLHMSDVQLDMTVEDEDNEILETCVIDDFESTYDCVVDDDHSDVGSMISIKAEEIIYDEDPELIVPEVLEEEEIAPLSPSSPEPQQVVIKPLQQGSWPTLEILPGGVINFVEKPYVNNKMPRNKIMTKEMVYACAKCEQGFENLMVLVKHVRLHDFEQGRQRCKITSFDKKMEDLERRGNEIDSDFKDYKKNDESLVVVAEESRHKNKVKEKLRKIVKPKVRKLPKK